MKTINIDACGTIHIEQIYKDEFYTEEVTQEESDNILEDLRTGNLLFNLSSRTIVDLINFKEQYWCSISAGNDMEYQFTNYTKL